MIEPVIQSADDEDLADEALDRTKPELCCRYQTHNTTNKGLSDD